MLRDCRRRVRWFSNFVVIRRISGRGRENITAGPERERGERDRRNRGRYCALEIPCFPINHVETRSITWNSSVPAIFWRLPSVSSYGQCDRAAESKSLLKGGVSGVPFRKRKKKEKERRKRKNREREKKKERKREKRRKEWPSDWKWYILRRALVILGPIGYFHYSLVQVRGIAQKIPTRVSKYYI